MIYFPQGAIIEYPRQVVENTAPDIAILDRMLGGEAKYGKLHLREDMILNYEGWLAPKPIVEYVKAPESVGIMIPTEGRYHPAIITGTTINDSLIKLNMRDVGKYLSLEHNFRQHLMDYMKSNEGQQLASFLNKSGYKAEDIKYIAIGFVPKEAIYGVKELSDGKIAIYAHKDSYRKIANEAEGFGMETEELREVAIGEEMTHIFRKSRPSIAEEEATKTMLKEFYETLAKTTLNPNLKAKYERIIKHLEHDISTVSRYAKINSNSLQDLVDLYSADIGELVSVLEGKALYEGINTEKGIAKYVSEKLERIAKAAKNEYSGKDEVTEKGLDAKISDSAEKAESVEGEDAGATEAEACAETSEGNSSNGGGEGGE